jgi:isopentenyl phosphate kinase
MKLVKLGGSVITYKGERKRFRRGVMEALAKQLAPFKEGLCLVHGGGSFGHPLSHRYSLHGGMAGGQDLLGFAEVHRSMRELNQRVLRALHGWQVPAVSIPAATLVSVRGGRVVDFRGEAFIQHLKAGLVPVTFGDVVLDALKGSAILSGDDLMVELTRLLEPEAAIFVTDVDGVRGADGSLLPLITSSLPDIPWQREETDVTGGMRRKLDIMLDIAKEGCRCLLINGMVPERLQAALKGRKVPCTEVRWV